MLSYKMVTETFWILSIEIFSLCPHLFFVDIYTKKYGQFLTNDLRIYKLLWKIIIALRRYNFWLNTEADLIVLYRRTPPPPLLVSWPFMWTVTNTSLSQWIDYRNPPSQFGLPRWMLNNMWNHHFHLTHWTTDTCNSKSRPDLEMGCGMLI